MSNKDTLAVVDDSIAKENEALIEQMLRDAQKAQLEGELDKNPIVHKGDADLPAPMTVKEMTNAGYVWIFDTRTGERIPCIYYMVASKLRTRRKDGSFRFTTQDPGFRPKKGEIKCMLHPEGEKRAHFDDLGFRTCPKANLTNQYQLEQHMKKKHPQEWAAIKNEEEKQHKEEDRALQRLILASLAGKQEPQIKTSPDALNAKSDGEEAPLYVSDKPKKTKK